MARIIRAMTKDGSARAVVIDSTDIVARAIEIHGCLPTAAAALGRLLTGASMLGSLMSGKDELLTLRVKGDGGGGTIVASADYLGNVRGFIQNPVFDTKRRADGKLDVAKCVGTGQLFVLRDTGEGEPYVGVSQLVSGEIAEDIAYYFVTSEQIPTLLSLGVLLNKDCCLSAGGAFIQLLPGADMSIIDILEANIKKHPQATTLLLERGLEGALDALLCGIEYDVFDTIECSYVCKCAREKTEAALLSLGKSELAKLIEENGNSPTEMTCQFCDKVYSFTKNELLDLYSTL